MSNDKAAATSHPQTAEERYAAADAKGWDRTNPNEWAPVPAATAVPTQQIIVNQPERRRTNHGLHLVLSIVTLGMWVPVWIVVGITNAAHR